MPFSSCAEQSLRQDVPLIGTAPPTQCFVMIECPPPWGQTIQQAKFLPPALRNMVAAPFYKERGIRFFLIKAAEECRIRPKFSESPGYRMLIFSRPQGFVSGYSIQEARVSSLEEAAIALQRYFAGKTLSFHTPAIPTRDIFICTHGQYDRCCGCYGYPFYREAQRLKQQWKIPHLRLWQISHIGGHRFAPTLIDLPQGRYYGRMDLEHFKLLVLQQGDWRSLLDCYRGWSVLPKPLQTLEQLFWRNQGWQWLNQEIDYALLPTSENQPHWHAQFVHRETYGLTQEWWAEVVEDVGKRTEVLGSCGDTKTAWAKTYKVSTLQAVKDIEQPVA